MLGHYPDEAAEELGHLDTAISEFQAMKMQTYVERALYRHEILRA